MTGPLNLDWSTAEVSDGTLTIALDDTPPKEWCVVFERTATLLGAGNWEVKMHAKRGSVEIATVQPGDEERVRQFLEGVLLEANSRAVDEPVSSEDGEDDKPNSGDADSEPSPDAALTDSFREFARESPDGGEKETG